MLLGYQASLAVQHGFLDKPGFTLCAAKTGFLSRFEQGAPAPENLKKSLAFATQYFPLDLIAFASNPEVFDGKCLRSDIGIEMDFVGSGRDGMDSTLAKLYCSFGDEAPLHSRMRQLIPQDLVSFILQYTCRRNVSARSMIALQQAFGLDNEGLGMAPDHHDLQRLLDAGFRFSPATKVVEQSRNINGKLQHWQRESDKESAVFLDLFVRRVTVERCKPTPSDLQVLDEGYRNAIRLGLWPCKQQSLRPKTVVAALKALAKIPAILKTDNYHQSLLAYLDIAGAEKCAKAAKAADQWRLLRDHFGHEVMQPLLRHTSREVRGVALEDDLGM